VTRVSSGRNRPSHDVAKAKFPKTVFCKFEFPTHAFGADETLDSLSLDQIRGGITLHSMAA
jgi:hypothetical protein